MVVDVWTDPNTWSIALSLLALACSVVLLVRFERESDSAVAKKALESCRELVQKRDAEADLFTAQREAWMLEFAALAERCDEALERAESKRRRIAASESRNRHAQPEQPEQMTREQIIEYARRRTLGGA